MSNEPFTVAGENQLGVDRIATSPLAYILYENPLGIFRGAPGAPRLSPWATVTPVTAGGTVRYADSYRYNLIQTMSRGNWQMMTKVMVLATGTLRATFSTIRPSEGELKAKLVRIRGEATTDISGDFTHSSASGSASIGQTVTTFDVLPGDSIVLAARFSSEDPSTGYGAVDNFRLRTAGEYFWAIGGGSMVLETEPP